LNGHVSAWLEAYHDGELRGRRRRQVEAHLEGCATCRAELEGLRALTALLWESPAAGELAPSDRFVAQVRLRLSRRPEWPAWQRTLELSWRLVPLGLLGALAFVQAMFITAGLVLQVLQIGLGSRLTAWLLPVSGYAPWLAGALRLSGAATADVGRAVWHLLRHGGALSWTTVLNLVSLAVIGLLYWSWLASWWIRRQRRSR